MNFCHESNWKYTIPWIIGGIFLAAGAALLFGVFVMLLWNWLMPVIFGLGKISYLQAWGLVLLSHLLFKAGHDHHNHDHGPGEFWKKKIQRKFRERAEHTEDTTE